MLKINTVSCFSFWERYGLRRWSLVTKMHAGRFFCSECSSGTSEGISTETAALATQRRGEDVYNMMSEETRPGIDSAIQTASKRSATLCDIC